MSPTFEEVAKFIADKLVIGLVVVVATFYGDFLLEKYKVSSSVSVADSNEFSRRIGDLWAKAYEVEAEADHLSSLYERMFSPEVIRPPLDELQKKIDTQQALMEDKFKELWGLIHQHRFYLGESVSQYIIWYATLARSTPGIAETTAYRVKEFARMLEDPVKWPVVNDEAYRKREEEAVEKGRQRFLEYQESINKDLAKLRFGYPAARRYSLQQLP